MADLDVNFLYDDDYKHDAPGPNVKALLAEALRDGANFQKDLPGAYSYPSYSHLCIKRVDPVSTLYSI